MANTMKDKISKLLETVKKDFPDGCDGILCENCPVYEHEDDGTIKSAICEMLSMIEYQSKV